MVEIADALQRNYDVVVKAPEFEWDPAKNQANVRKHGVSFEEAQTAFSDERGLLIHDPDHSDDEDRFVLLGLVCHCYRRAGDVIRIISARKADRRERQKYSQRWAP